MGWRNLSTRWDARRLYSHISPMLTRKSLVSSKLSQLLAILGATFRRLGTIPLNRPRIPSSAIMTFTASTTDVYRYPMPDIVLIWNRRRKTSLLQQWWVWGRPCVKMTVVCGSLTMDRCKSEPLPRKLPRLIIYERNWALFRLRGWDKCEPIHMSWNLDQPIAVSPQAKFINCDVNAVLTYGATPATVGIIPRYNATMPPSFLYIRIMVVSIPGNGSPAPRWPSAANEADWIESRVLTMSRG